MQIGEYVRMNGSLDELLPRLRALPAFHPESVGARGKLI